MDFTFDLTELDRYVLSLEFLRVWDIRKEVKIHIRSQGAGEIVFRQKAYYLERVQFALSHKKSFAGYTMAN